MILESMHLQVAKIKSRFFAISIISNELLSNACLLESVCLPGYGIAFCHWKFVFFHQFLKRLEAPFEWYLPPGRWALNWQIEATQKLNINLTFFIIMQTLMIVCIRKYSWKSRYVTAIYFWLQQNKKEKVWK